MRKTRKRILLLTVTVAFVGFFLLYCAAHGAADRKASLISARYVLRQAYDEYVQTGNLPSRNGSWKIMSYTNEVLVAGRKIQMVAATTLPNADPSWGLFAIAPTGEIVWLKGDRKAVLVSDPHYEVPLWGSEY